MMKHTADQKTSTTTRDAATRTKEALTSQEENVVRMRHGLTTPADHQLDSKAAGNKALMMELIEMEKRALSTVGSRSSATKRKIVNALRRK